jgi:hypothetical protein
MVFTIRSVAMSHHCAATKIIAVRRRLYTGEPLSSVLPLAHAASRGLKAGERRILANFLTDVVEHDRSTDALRHQVGDRVRQALLPDTDSALQRRLETAILIALGRVVFHRRPGRLRREPVCSAIRLDADGQLALQLGPSALAPLLDELHLPGLRVVRHQRRVELRLGEGERRATVTLSSIAPRHWIAASRYAHTLSGARWPAECGHLVPTPNPLRSTESRPGIVALCSWLLRRLAALGTTNWLAIDVDDDEPVVHVTWAGGRPAEDVLGHLTHPLGGLPPQHFSVDLQDKGLIAVTVHLGMNLPAAHLALHSLPAEMPPPSLRLDTESAWAAFDDLLTRPAYDVRRTAS